MASASAPGWVLYQARAPANYTYITFAYVRNAIYTCPCLRTRRAHRWGNEGHSCCVRDAGLDADAYPCPSGSRPIKAARSGLPANPFLAALTAAGKCACMPPQVCDA